MIHPIILIFYFHIRVLPNSLSFNRWKILTSYAYYRYSLCLKCGRSGSSWSSHRSRRPGNMSTSILHFRYAFPPSTRRLFLCILHQKPSD
jgi:hypothetical protein